MPRPGKRVVCECKDILRTSDVPAQPVLDGVGAIIRYRLSTFDDIFVV